ncbi:MAG: hypothetical protein ACLP19_16060 [Xanthobacteraceae bacterium]
MLTTTELLKDPPYTIEEFCELERIGISTYYKMQRLGYGPDETRIPGIGIVRITHAARLAWHKRLAALRNTEMTKLEAARRTAAAIHAGRAAAASPLHVSKNTARKSRRRR